MGVLRTYKRVRLPLIGSFCQGASLAVALNSDWSYGNYVTMLVLVFLMVEGGFADAGPRSVRPCLRNPFQGAYKFLHLRSCTRGGAECAWYVSLHNTCAVRVRRQGRWAPVLPGLPNNRLNVRSSSGCVKTLHGRRRWNESRQLGSCR